MAGMLLLGGRNTIGQTVLNFNAASGGGPTQSYLNLVHGLSLSSSTANWQNQITTDGYPTGTTTAAFTLNNFPLVPNYYGRYKTWWTGSAVNVSLSQGAIIYSGGLAVFGLGASTGSVGFNLGFGAGTGANQQPTSAVPIEFAFGALVNAIADNGSGFVRLTSPNANGFSQYAVGTSMQINNVTNLAAGPYTVTAKTSTTVDLNVAYNGTMAVVGGGAGPQSEAIAAQTSSTYSIGAGTFTGWSNWVLCRSADVAAINAGQLVNPDHVTNLQALNPRFIRLMDFVAVQNSKVTNFTYRPKVSNLSWGLNQVTQYYAGDATNGGSDVYTVANPSASPASGAYVDGEIVYAHISGVNTGYVPTLQISGRTGAVAAPIYNNSATLMSIILSGSVPPVGSVISLLFTGGGLSTPYTLNYTTVGSDTTIQAIVTHLADSVTGKVNVDATLSAAGIKAVNNEIASTSTGFTINFNPNINSAGVAALGNGMTLSGSDNGGAGTVYTVGTVAPGYLVNGRYVYFQWSKLLNGWTSNVSSNTLTGGLNGGPPLEYYEELCTRANVGAWYTFGLFNDANCITQTVSHFATAGVKELAIELSNETWNSSAAEWAPTTHLGNMLGLGTDAQNAFYGLRTAQMADLARAAWGAAGRSQAALFIVNAYQFVSPSTTNRFNGTSLNPASNVTLAAYGNYGATAVSINHSAFPNRPVDKSDFVSPAPYFRGVAFNTSFGTSLKTSSVTLSSYDAMLLAGYNYAYGTPTQQQAALDFMFNGTSGDFYTTTPLSGATLSSGVTLASWAHGSGVTGADYFGITTIVAGYDAARTGTNANTGLPWNLLGVACYEGDQEAGPVNGSEATTIAGNLTTLGYSNGYSSSLVGAASGGPTGASDTAALAATNLQGLLLAFKNDDRFRLLYLKYFNDFKTAVQSQGVRTALPATFGFEGGGTWGKYPTSIYTTGYKSIGAIQTFNG